MSFFFRATRLAAALLIAGFIGLAGLGATNAVAQTPADAAEVSTATEAMDLYLSLMNKIVGALENVTDDASADAAARTINETAQTMDVLAEKTEDQITPQQWMAATTPRQQEMMQVQSRMSAEFMRLAQSNPALMQRLAETMKNLPTVGR